MVEALGEPYEGPADQEHAHGRQRERERDGAPDAACRALRVDVGRHRGRHQGQRDPDRLPQAQLPPQVRALDAASTADFRGHRDPLVLWQGTGDGQTASTHLTGTSACSVNT